MPFGEDRERTIRHAKRRMVELKDDPRERARVEEIVEIVEENRFPDDDAEAPTP